MKRIPLTQGEFALVDDDDYERCSAHAWHLKRSKTNLYAATNIGKRPNRKTLRLHHFVLEFYGEIHHINHNGLDCQRLNLTPATRTQNARHVILRSDNLSRLKGVSRTKSGNFMARIGSKDSYLGTFNTAREAAAAYDAAAVSRYGAFALTNAQMGLL